MQIQGAIVSTCSITVITKFDLSYIFLLSTGVIVKIFKLPSPLFMIGKVPRLISVSSRVDMGKQKMMNNEVDQILRSVFA